MREEAIAMGAGEESALFPIPHSPPSPDTVLSKTDAILDKNHWLILEQGKRIRIKLI